MSNTITRRRFMHAGLVTGLGLTAGCSKDNAMTDKLWAKWQADWRLMEAIARKRGWEVHPLAMARPASEATVAKLEKRHGIKVPSQLRQMLTGYSSSIGFGWRIPQHLRPMERVEHLYPTSGGIRDHIWNLEFIDQYAIPNFLSWKRDLADKDLTEATNKPEFWEHQFPFGHLMNGDMLTIDVSKPDEVQQPVRYFSHDVEGLHGFELAPDFFTFISVYAALGSAGQTHDDWFRFIGKRDEERRIAHLSATGDGAKTWFAWRDGGTDDRHPDDPPPAVLGATAADRALLTAAHGNSLPGVTAALAAGAKSDCIWNSEWGDNPAFYYETEFWTAITHAVKRNNLEMVDLLLKRGARLNTRHLPMNTAVEEASLETVRGLIARGARVDGWRHQRKWPLHALVTGRGATAGQTREEYRKSIEAKFGTSDSMRDVLAAADPDTRAAMREALVQMQKGERKRVDEKLAAFIDGPTYDAMLDGLLTAGAAPDAPWDNGITMLMWGGVETGKRLLKHRANVHARDTHGWTVLHRADIAEKVKLLVAHGADINAAATPNMETDTLTFTPLQAALMRGSRSTLDLVHTYLDLGADPKRRDGAGRNSLAYCFSIQALDLMRARGLDPQERLPGGQTLLHNLTTMSHPPRVSHPDEVAFFKRLLSLGIDINARDDQGRTMMHLAAAREAYDQNGPNYALLLETGADKSIKDNNGRRAVDLLATSLRSVRAVLQ